MNVSKLLIFGLFSAVSASAYPVVGDTVTYQCAGMGPSKVQTKQIVGVYPASNLILVTETNISNGRTTVRQDQLQLNAYLKNEAFEQNLVQNCGGPTARNAVLMTLSTVAGQLQVCHRYNSIGQELWSANVPFRVAQLRSNRQMCTITSYKKL